MISPVFEQLEAANPDVHFYKVDVDVSDDICTEQNIESMPTFIFAKQGRVLNKMSGANEEKLRKLIAQYK
jgi:thioredoxin 1